MLTTKIFLLINLYNIDAIYIIKKKNIKKYLVSIDYFSNFADIYNKGQKKKFEK